MGSVKAILEGGFKFSASEEMRKFSITASADSGVLGGLSRSDKGASDQAISGN